MYLQKIHHAHMSNTTYRTGYIVQYEMYDSNFRLAAAAAAESLISMPSTLTNKPDSLPSGTYSYTVRTCSTHRIRSSWRGVKTYSTVLFCNPCGIRLHGM